MKNNYKFVHCLVLLLFGFGVANIDAMKLKKREKKILENKDNLKRFIDVVEYNFVYSGYDEVKKQKIFTDLKPLKDFWRALVKNASEKPSQSTLTSFEKLIASCKIELKMIMPSI